MYLLGNLTVQSGLAVFGINSADEGIQGNIQQSCVVDQDTQRHSGTVVLHVADVAWGYVQSSGNFCLSQLHFDSKLFHSGS